MRLSPSRGWKSWSTSPSAARRMMRCSRAWRTPSGKSGGSADWRSMRLGWARRSRGCEMEAARVHYRPNQQMNFFVEPADGHDDYLVSAALAVEAAKEIETRPRIARGRFGE